MAPFTGDTPGVSADDQRVRPPRPEAGPHDSEPNDRHHPHRCPTGLEELAQLGRTLHRRRADILGYFTHRASDGRTDRSDQRTPGSAAPQRTRLPEPYPPPHPVTAALLQPDPSTACTLKPEGPTSGWSFPRCCSVRALSSMWAANRGCPTPAGRNEFTALIDPQPHVCR